MSIARHHRPVPLGAVLCRSLQPCVCGSFAQAAVDPVVKSLVTGSLRPHLKNLSRESREALLLALLEDAPKDMQCDLLDCEFHDHNR